MNRLSVSAAAIMLATAAFAEDAGPYKVLKTAKVGGAGGFDYVNADEGGRKLYIARSGEAPRIAVFDLDTLAPTGEIPGVSAHGVAISRKSNHGFTSSKPAVMFDATTLEKLKTIDVDGRPDGLLYDAFNDRVYVFSRAAPNATVINASDGSIAGTIDLGGAPEQAASDGQGRVYVAIEDKDNIAVVDAATLKVTARYELAGKGGACAGLALDVKNGLLFAACRAPQNMVVLRAKNGKILAALPIGHGTDGAAFNPKTREAFSSQGDGSLTIVKEDGRGAFSVEQTVQTMTGAKTMALDAGTNRVFVIGAEYEQAPAQQAPTPGGRIARKMVPDSFSIVVVGK